MAEEKIKALQELLKLIAEHPDLAERITITIKPAKLTQGTKPESKQLQGRERAEATAPLVSPIITHK